MPDSPQAAPFTVCVIGGGASGIGLIWTLAQAKQRGVAPANLEIHLIHSEESVGGHSMTYPTTLGGQPVAIDLGVQMIAPKMYPLVMSMLAPKAFSSITTTPVPLNISCFFPPVNGTTPYWGNFGDYLNTPLAQTGAHDVNIFQSLIAPGQIGDHVWEYLDTIADYLDENRSEFDDLDRFETYFLDPYMSIMNGYGNALLTSAVVGDIAPLWDFGYASFTQEVTGYARFEKGAESWVAEMWSQAQALLGDSLKPQFSTNVTEFYPSPEGPTVVARPAGTDPPYAPVAYNALVSTLDMHTNSTAMNTPANALWKSLYAGTVGTATNGNATDMWDLQPGMCYLHQDDSILAPNPNPGTKRPETLQFTATYATNKTPYDLTNTFATYIESNLMGVEVDDPKQDIYLTMYGYDPVANGVKAPESFLAKVPWNHGMYLPTFMLESKVRFHRAQSVSPYHRAHSYQQNTGIFFAGNNLTMDSEEGALASGMAVAQYAFGVDPIAMLIPPGTPPSETLALAAAEFAGLYTLMFPPVL